MAEEGKLDPVVGRDKEIARLIQILSRRTKNNPCLTGEPGVGKTAIVEGLAQRIVTGMVPDTVKDKRVVVLDLSGMVAGSKYRGEFEERIRNVIDEVSEQQEYCSLLMRSIRSSEQVERKVHWMLQYPETVSFRGEIQLIEQRHWKNIGNTLKRMQRLNGVFSLSSWKSLQKRRLLKS